MLMDGRRPKRCAGPRKSPSAATRHAVPSSIMPAVGCRLCALIAACARACGGARANKELPVPHLQFSTRIETTAHQLNATSDYPPYKCCAPAAACVRATRVREASRLDTRFAQEIYDGLLRLPRTPLAHRLRPGTAHAAEVIRTTVRQRRAAVAGALTTADLAAAAVTAGAAPATSPPPPAPSLPPPQALSGW